MPLAPLEAADTARLAESIRGAPLLDGDRTLLQAATGGFPLHVVEAMRTADGSGRASLPAGDLEAVLRRRLEQVSPTARELAGLAAAVGRDFDLDLLVEASDLDADSVVQAVDELWRLRIVHECGDGYDFSHDLLRAAAYERVSPPRRWLLHRRLAQGLELLHADDTGPVSAQLAEQYARGGRPERAVAHYRRAADVASGVFAHADAIRLHSAALAIVRARPPGRDRDRQELDVLEAMAAPLNARHGYSSPGCRRCSSARSSWQSPWAATTPCSAASSGCGPPGSSRDTSPTRTAPRSGPSASCTRGPTSAARPTSRVPGRPSGSGCRRRRCATSTRPRAWRPTRRSASAPVPTSTVRPGRRTPTGCSVTTTWPCPAARTPSPPPARSTTPTAWRWHWRTPASPTSCSATVTRWRAWSPSCATSVTGTDSPTTASGGSSCRAGCRGARRGSP